MFVKATASCVASEWDPYSRLYCGQEAPAVPLLAMPVLDRIHFSPVLFVSTLPPHSAKRPNMFSTYLKSFFVMDDPPTVALMKINIMTNLASSTNIATILREADPTIRTEWCNIKKGGQPGSIMNYYPGDDYVDIFGVNYYDGWPPLSTQAIWDSQYYADYKGGPWGIGAWAAEARRRGKKIACSEWGINAGRYDCADNPLYIENMHQFFSANADILAYENYFNQKGYHQLTPNDLNPRSSARYKQLWGAVAS